ncbi:MAG TPA: isoprenylcysteine carboxylmethyltransferase family protein, partial [Arthrobacter sp.]
IPIPYRWMGVLVLFSGGVLFVLTLHTLGTNLTDTVVTRREHFLVTDGPYRWVRHPFYVSAAVLYASAALVTGSLLLFISGLLTLAVLVVRTRKEEDQLLQRFGDEYCRYMQRTGRFFPRFFSRT